MSEVRRLTVPCARCGRPAAEFALVPAGVDGPEAWAKGDRLERTGFIGAVIHYGTYAALTGWFEQIARGEWAAARGQDADLVAFVCWQCGRPYCSQCWSQPRLEFDDGFYDCAYADCPEGHTQIVDD